MASKHIKRNTYYTFVFSVSDAKSAYDACLHLQLDLRCQRMSSSLLPGNCIMRSTQASWNNAMWCKIDFVEPARNLGPIQYEAHTYTPAVSICDVPQVLADFNTAVEEYKKAKKRQEDEKTPYIEQYAMKLLRLRARNPYAPVARLFDVIDIRFEAQIAVRQMLENNGRGSIYHRHCAYWIKFYYEKLGRKAFVEWVVPGTKHPVDTSVEAGNKWEVFEVCVTSFNNVISHIKACFEDGSDVERLTIVVGTKTKLKELKKQIQSDFMFTLHKDKIEFEIIQNFIIKELQNYESD